MTEKANSIANELAREWMEETAAEMARLQKKFKELYDAHSGFIGVGIEGVHVRPDFFLRLFKGYKVTERDSADYPVQFSAEHDGVTFFCILQPEEWQAIRQEGEEEQ